MAMVKGKRGAQKAKIPSSNSVVYRGPVRLTKVPRDEMITVTLSNIYTVTGGTLGIQFSSYISPVASAPNWGSYINAYNEARVIAVSCRYIPGHRSGDNTVVHAAGLGVVTSTGVNPGPFTALSTMIQYDYQTVHSGEPFSMRWGMSSVEEGQWGPSSNTPGDHCWLTAFIPGASTTTSGAYGWQITDWLVQFRGQS